MKANKAVEHNAAKRGEVHRHRSRTHVSSRPSMREDLRGLWSIAWRALVVGPVVVPLGYAVLVLVMASLVLPPLYAGICLCAGDYVLGGLVVAGWAVWLRFAPRLLKPVLENWRYGA